MDAAWAQVYAVWAQVVVGLLQTGLIGWGLYMMQQASNQRNRQLDQHGQALDQQGQALTDIGQALRDQGLALQELLRRSEPQP